jgi:hypothetical protein
MYGVGTSSAPANHQGFEFLSAFGVESSIGEFYMATPTAPQSPNLSGLAQAGTAQQPQAAPSQDQAQPDSPQQESSQTDSTQNAASESDTDSSLPEDDTDAPVNIQRAFSALNAAITKLLDELGVKRSFTVPYVDGQPMAEHIKAVGAAAAQAGGLGNNLLTTSHHADGRGYGYGDGHTVGHGVESLRNTIIPKGDENAKDAIQAAGSLLNKIAALLGDDEPAVKTAQSQLKLVAKNEGAQMTLFDFAVFLIQIVHSPIQALSRAISATHPDGPSVRLRAPKGKYTHEAGSSKRSIKGKK